MKITLDLRGCATPEAVQEALRRGLAFPEYYGYNLDALHDMLTQWDRGCGLALRLPGAPAEKVKDYLPKIKRVFEDAARENPRLRVQIK